MSTDRFLRLPEEKRNRFLKAAWDEFTNTRFMNVSINQIIRKAGIPRGSFYQYFTDKEDLFSYLLGSVQQRFMEDYRQILAEAKGDLFQAQVLSFDRVMNQDPSSDPLLEGCLQFLRNNPGLDLQKILPGKPGYQLIDNLWEELDLQGFRRTDREYVCRVFALSLMVLGGVLMDSLFWPEHREERRRELLLRLDILKHGCMAGKA